MTLETRAQDHPSADANRKSGLYWNIKTTGSGEVSLILPQADLFHPSVCVWNDPNWDCDGTSTTTSATRTSISDLDNEWTVGFLFPLTVTADSYSRKYGAANMSFEASYDGLIETDTAASLGGSLNIAASADIASPVGPYDLIPSGQTSLRYFISYEKGTLTVEPAPLKVTADPINRQYGADHPEFSVAYDQFVNGENETDLGSELTFTGSATQAGLATQAGQYEILPGGLTSTNYAITFHAAQLTITPADLVVEIQTVDLALRPVGAKVQFTVAPVVPSPVPVDDSLNITVRDGALVCTGTIADGYCIVELFQPGEYTFTAEFLGSTNYTATVSDEKTQSLLWYRHFFPVSAGGGG